MPFSIGLCLGLSGHSPTLSVLKLVQIMTKQQQTDIEQKIEFLQQELSSFLVQVEDFFNSVQQQNLFRKVVLHKQKSGLEKFGAEFSDLYIPNFRWVEYIGEKRKYLDWNNIAYILNRANATLDERIFHIQMNYEFNRLRLEVKSAVNRLKDMIILSQEFQQQIEEQGISFKMFDRLIA